MKSKRESEGNKSLRLRLNKAKTQINKFHWKKRKNLQKNAKYKSEIRAVQRKKETLSLQIHQNVSYSVAELSSEY